MNPEFRRTNGIAMMAAVVIVIVVVAAVGVGAYYYVTTGKSSSTTTGAPASLITTQQTTVTSSTPKPSTVTSVTPTTSSVVPITTTSLATSTQTTAPLQTSTSTLQSTTSSKQQSTTSSPLISTSSSTSTKGTSTSSSTQGTTTTSTSSSSQVSTTTTAKSTSSTAATSTTSLACTTTYSTSTGQAQLPNYAPLFASFSALAISEKVTSNTSSTTISSSYNVQSHSGSGSSATYLVALSESVGSTSINSTASYRGDGTLVWLYYIGQNFSGSIGGSVFSGLMSPFTLELNAQATYQVYLNSANVVQVNKTTVSIGQSSVSVTNYKATNTPFTESSCGYSSTINSFLLQIGQVQGSSYGSLITYELFNGVSQGTPFNYVLQVTSLTKA